MATCKDCIHCRACHEMYLVAVSQEDDFFERNDADTCEDFKHKYSFAEVKHGEWIYNTNDFTPKMRCSVCGYNKPIAAGENIEQQPSDYCNKCGAKMDGERK